MKNIITFCMTVLLCSYAIGATEINISNLKEENLLVLKLIKGGEAKPVCEKKHSSKGDANSIFRAVEKCIKGGVEVADKVQTGLNVSNFCNFKSNQTKYGFTSDNKCKRKLIDVIENNFIMH